MVRNRNLAAHESRADFARLLLTPTYHNSQEFYCWASLFPWVYGKTIEQVAKEDLEEEPDFSVYIQ